MEKSNFLTSRWVFVGFVGLLLGCQPNTKNLERVRLGHDVGFVGFFLKNHFNTFFLSFFLIILGGTQQTQQPNKNQYGLRAISERGQDNKPNTKNVETAAKLGKSRLLGCWVVNPTKLVGTQQQPNRR